MRQREALEATAGAWKDEDHPDLMTDEDVERFIDELRGRRTPLVPDSEKPPERYIFPGLNDVYQ
ncbi:MAG: hypothetical protein HYX92_13760 [Chloroflexi bacterium]|nr:hypothetical protein [Chloroflexota bacterium]